MQMGYMMAWPAVAIFVAIYLILKGKIGFYRGLIFL
jgi:hypothetical protein